MKREELASRLVDPFGDKVSGVDVACVKGLLISGLCIRFTDADRLPFIISMFI